jgi:hypothetical protein
MARKRYKPEEIVAKLRQVDVLVSQGQGITVTASCPAGRSVVHCNKSRAHSHPELRRPLRQWSMQRSRQTQQ